MRHIIVGETTKHRILAGAILLTFLIIILTIPKITSADSRWNLQITTPNGTTTAMTYEDLLALPETAVSANLACYGTPIKYGDWQGVKLSDILDTAGFDQTVLSIDFGAQDGYSVSIPIDTAIRQDVIVAYAMNGVPLSETLRLVIPGANGNVWIAMITKISMSNVPLSDSISTPGQALYTQNQYMNRIAANAMNQSSPQQLQPSPSASNAHSEPTPTPNSTTTSVAQPSAQKATGQETLNSGFQAIYFVALGFAVTLVAVGFAVYRHRRLKRKLKI